MRRTVHDSAPRVGLICTVCGHKTQPKMQKHDEIAAAYCAGLPLPATIDAVCQQCMRDRDGGLRTVCVPHFVDTLHA